MNKFIALTEPHYCGGEIIDEKIFLSTSTISEILPHGAVACRGDDDGWKTKIIMNNGDKYNVVEDPERVIELITAVELG